MFDIFFKPVGHGQFTCCKLNHEVKGEKKKIISNKNVSVSRIIKIPWKFKIFTYIAFAVDYFSFLFLGEKISCDRPVVAGYLHKLVSKLLSFYRTTGNMKAYHFLRTMWPVLFTELPTPDILIPELVDDSLPYPKVLYEILGRNLEEVRWAIELEKFDVEENFGEQNFRLLSEMRILGKTKVVIFYFVG